MRNEVCVVLSDEEGHTELFTIAQFRNKFTVLTSQYEEAMVLHIPAQKIYIQGISDYNFLIFSAHDGAGRALPTSGGQPVLRLAFCSSGLVSMTSIMDYCLIAHRTALSK